MGDEVGFANCLKLLHLIIVRPVKLRKAPFLCVVFSSAAFVRVPAAGQGSGLAGRPVGTVLCHPDVLAELSGWL